MKHLFTLLFFLTYIAASSQTYPVQVNAQLMPPYTPYLSDYTAPGSQKLMVQIRLNDPTITEYTCKLRITIEGVNITIRTKPSFVSQPITIQGGGIPELFYGEDLAEYFNPNALDFAGITRAQYEKGAKLPEGVYRFTIEVLDYNRNTIVSNKGNAMAWVILNDPPILNLPRIGTKIKIIDPNNIPFTWTPRHTGSPNAAFTTEYIFRLVEIWPLNRNPYDAFLSSPVLYETTTNLTQIVYGPAEPALIQGRKYAWQVQAIDADGRDLFKNQGKSEVFVFQYGDALGIPEGLYLQTATGSSLTFRWEPPINAPAGPVTYRLRYRPHDNRKSENWYEIVTEDPYKAIGQLAPATQYEVQVRAEQGSQVSEYGPQQLFKTNPAGSDEFVCKSDVALPPIPTGSTPTRPLGINDIIHAGGYEVVVKKVTASGGTYTGEGLVIVPWFKLAKVRATFKNISVNDQYWLTAGEIKTIWNPDSKFLIKVPNKDSLNAAPDVGEVSVSVAATDSLIEITGAAIVTVTKNIEGNIEVKTSDGETRELPKGTSYAIVDKVGNGYVVDKEGNITKTTADAALATSERGNRDYNIGLRFEKGAGKFGFDQKKYDALAQYYQTIGEGQAVAWKAITSKEPDVVDAILEGKDYDPKKIRFEVSGAPVTPTTTTGKFTLSLTGKAEGSDEELLAIYSAGDNASDEVLGKLNLVSYDKITRNLVVVPVNMDAAPFGLNAVALTQDLTNVYRQAIAGWNVSMALPIKVELNKTFDDGGTGMFSNYTEDMRKVINAYGKLQDNTYYVFLISESPVSGVTAQGRMPRSKQAGFIFTSNHTSAAAVTNTMAHEIGHGAFNLQHTFKEFTNLTQGTTDNLMDYTNGVGDKLYKYQWDHIHEPQRVIGLFEDDEEGASVSIILADKGFFNDDCVFSEINDCSSRNVLLPSNVVVKLDASVKQVCIQNNRLISFKVGSNIYTPFFFVESDKKTYLGHTPSYYYVDWNSVDLVANTSASEITTEIMYDADKNPITVYKNIVGSKYAIKLEAVSECEGEIVIGTSNKCYTVLASDCENSNSTGSGANGSVVNFSKQTFSNSEIEKLLNGEKKYSDRLAGDMRGIRVKVFLTDASTEAKDLEYIKNYKPQNNERVARLHYDGKIWHLETGESEAAKKISSAFVSNGLPGLSFNDFLSEIQELYKENPLDNAIVALYGFFDCAEKFINKAKIPESVWNCDLKNPKDPYDPIYAKVVGYLLNPMASIFSSVQLNVLGKLTSPDSKEAEFINSLQGTIDKGNQIQFAFICGLWDGIVDIPGGLAAILKTVTGAISSKGIEDFQKLYNTMDGYKREDPEGVVVASGWWSCMKDGMADQFSVSKPCQLAHNIAPVVIGVVITYFTAGAGSEVLVQSTVGKFVLQVLSLLNKVDLITTKFSLGAKLVGKVGSTAFHLTVKLGSGSFKYVVNNGKIIFRVATRLGESFEDLDWSIVKTAELPGLDGKSYTVMMGVDPSENFSTIGKRIKSIIKDEKGNVLKDDNGNMMAKLDDADETPVIVKEAVSIDKIKQKLITELGFDESYFRKITEAIGEDADNFLRDLSENNSQAAKKLNLIIGSAEDAERAARVWKIGSKRSDIIWIRSTPESKAIAQDYWNNPLTDRGGYADFAKWYNEKFLNKLGDLAPFQANHIIPVDLLYTSKPLQEILQWAEKNGRLNELNFNGLDNGIMLSIADHSAPHPKFSAQMEEKILKIAEKSSNAEKFDDLKDLVVRVKKQIKDEVVNGSQKLNEITVK